MSVNEELQSTNEELETSKEELQSLNEELSTVNSQLAVKMDELHQRNNDLNNLLTSTETATIFLDTRFCIKLFTPAATGLMRLIATDIGRPISDMSPQFVDPNLLGDAVRVLKTLVPIAKEVATDDGRWYVRRIMPYRTEDNRIDGVVLTFNDITERKMSDDRTRSELAAIVESTTDGIIATTMDGTITNWNGGAEKLFGYPADEACGFNISRLLPVDRCAEFQMTVERLARGDEIRDFEAVLMGKNGRPVDVSLTVCFIKDPASRVTGVASIARDIKDRKLLERQLTESAEQERQRLGQELHDNLGQQLSALGILATSLQRSLEGAHAVSASQLAKNIEEAKSQVRALTHGLLPVEVDADGLMSALRGLAQRTHSAYDMSCSFECEEAVQISDNTTATHLFYVAREAVHNAIQHGQAQQIIIRLSNQTGVTLQIRDDGCGFPGDPAVCVGNGMRIMRHRAALITATLSVESPPEGGTVVTCSLRR